MHVREREGAPYAYPCVGSAACCMPAPWGLAQVVQGGWFCVLWVLTRYSALHAL
jgi:hypothetical protein